MGYLHWTSITTERPHIIMSLSLSGCLSPLLLVALCAAAPYDVSPSSTSAPVPEKLVESSKSVHCTVQYVTIWDTKYEDQPFEECETVYEQLCQVESQRLCQETTREECRLVQDKVCKQEYKKVCVEEYKTVVEPYTETECVTSYKEDCEYHWEVVGKEKIWAPIPGSCKKNPYDECHDVEKTHSKQVSYPVCHEVPQEKCHYVDRQECYQVPHQTCKSEPITKCQELPKEICHLKHKRVPIRVSKTIPKKVCETGDVDHVVPEHDFRPVPAVPVHVSAVPVHVPAIPVTTTQTPTTLTDILNRNDEPTFAFAGGNSLDDNKSNEFEKFVFQNNSTVNFEE